ncbi:MAG: hypothetical protein ACFCUQ_16075 [Kiloniellales bacterium]
MRHVIPAAALLVVAAPVLAGEALPAFRASFSADAVVEVGGERIVHRVYHAAGLERQEMLVDGLPQVTILRPDLDRAFVIQPGLDDYLELPLDEATLVPGLHDLENYEVEALGAAREGGEAVTRYRLSRQDEEQSLELQAWLTEDGIIMRLEGEMTFEGTPEHILLIRRDVQRGEQDPVLFEPEAARASISGGRELEMPEFPRNLGEAAQ